MSPTYLSKLPRFLWIVMPLAIWLYLFINAIPQVQWETDLSRESNTIEHATVAFLLLAALFAGLVLILRARSLLQRVVVGAFLLGCIYFGGEELSWGQHFFRWDTPEQWADINRQSETNLHNLDGPWRIVFLSLPRFLLSWGAVFASIVAPFWLNGPGHPQLARFSWNYWFWPSRQAGFVAVLAVGANLPENILNLFGVSAGIEIAGGTGEVKECLLGYFLFLYAWNWFRWRGWRESA